MNSLPSPEQATDILFGQIYRPAFLGRLESRGYSPRNEKEASDMLELAAKLQIAKEHEAEKVAADTGNFYAEANNALGYVLGVQVMPEQVKEAAAQDQMQSLNKIAADVMQDPDIFNSVLTQMSCEAGQFAQISG